MYRGSIDINELRNKPDSKYSPLVLKYEIAPNGKCKIVKNHIRKLEKLFLITMASRNGEKNIFKYDKDLYMDKYSRELEQLKKDYYNGDVVKIATVIANAADEMEKPGVSEKETKRENRKNMTPEEIREIINAKAREKYHNDEEYRKKMNTKSRKFRDAHKDDPEYKKKISEKNKMRYKDPEYKKKRKEYLDKKRQDPEWVEKQREKSRKKWQKEKNDPELLAKRREADKKYREAHKNDPDYKRKKAEKNHRWYEKSKQTPAYEKRREKDLARLKEYNERCKTDPELRERNRQKAKERYQKMKEDPVAYAKYLEKMREYSCQGYKRKRKK